MKRLTLGLVIAALLSSVIVLATDGPLTALMNLKGRTDENGYLRISAGAAGATDGPLTALANLRGRTDENGYLRVALAAIANAQTFTFGGATATVGGTLTTSTTSTCTTAVTTEEDLWTYSLPAGALDANGRGVRVTAFGTNGANANNKTMRVYFGATVVATNAGGFNNLPFRSETVVLRATATTQVGSGHLTNNVSILNTASTPAETLSGAVTIKVTGQNGTASAGDICVKGAIVETIK